MRDDLNEQENTQEAGRVQEVGRKRLSAAMFSFRVMIYTFEIVLDIQYVKVCDVMLRT